MPQKFKESGAYSTEAIGLVRGVQLLTVSLDLAPEKEKEWKEMVTEVISILPVWRTRISFSLEIVVAIHETTQKSRKWSMMDRS